MLSTSGRRVIFPGIPDSEEVTSAGKRFNAESHTRFDIRPIRSPVQGSADIQCRVSVLEMWNAEYFQIPYDPDPDSRPAGGDDCLRIV